MILIIDLNSQKLASSQFVAPIAAIVGRCDVFHYSQDFNPQDYSHIILSGTPLKDSEYLHHLDKFSWMESYSGKVLGICAGMQVLAKVFGAQLKDITEIGMTEITPAASNPLIPQKISAYSLHTLAVEASENFTTLATSKECIQAIKHKDKPFYGVLFHPEVRNQDIITTWLSFK